MAWTSDGSTSNQYIKWRLSWSESDINQANNTSKVTVKLYVRRTNSGYTTYGNGTAYIWINGTKYSGSITTSTKITSTEKCILTKSKTITHNNDGSKSINIAGDISHSQFNATYKSWSITLKTIPRASSISSISGSTIGSPISVNISRKSSSFTHTVEFYIGNTKISTWTKVATKQTFTPDMNTCCSKITNATSATAKINVTTYNGSTKIGNTVSKTFTIHVPSSVVPSITNFTVSPSNTNPLLKDSGLYVQGYTKYTASITAAGIYGSTISKYATSGGGTSTASASATSGVIDTSGSIQITATVTDSRGRTASATSDEIEVIPYYKPSITTNIYRCDDEGYEDDGGNNVYITILSKDFSSINGLNSITSIKVQYKKSTDDDLSWSNSQTISGTDLMLSNLSADYSYDLRFTIADAMGETTTFTTNVKTEKVILDFYNGGLGATFGGVAKESGLVSDFVFKPKGGRCIHYAKGESGVSGYVKFATINITRTHVNIPIQIVVTQRKKIADCKIHLLFTAVDGTDPEIDKALYESIYPGFNVYVVKSSTSQWDLYIEKAEAYDEIAVLDYTTNFHYMSVNITWKDESAITLPDGYIQVENYLDSGWKTPSINSSYFTEYTSGWRPMYRKKYGIVEITGGVKPVKTISGSMTEYTIFTLPSGFRPLKKMSEVMQGSGTDEWLFQVDSSTGNVTFSRYRANNSTSYKNVDTNVWLPFHTMFFAVG